ncbi:serine kinase [Bifidobacterium myosotis]|uniref:Homoserine kinase n=1 Tax=Bifidobacterium myosotis TaxID=1630166 RepID=A0A261FLY1_9BIFI|nr:homoserine kinase [Bifidobacterium myosotis]OZG59826.1 serine kinase [Bifidobacterium myosotis]
MNPICTQVKVRVPATSANLGSGFDTVGLALDYHDELTFTLNPDPSDGVAHVFIHGEGEDTLPRDETHLVVSTFRRACATFGLGRLGFTLEATNNIPQARGMGSSAEAIVAGIAAAAAFAQPGDLNRPAIFDMAAQIEGHPDNVAPAVFGGLTVSWDFATAEGVGSVAIPGGEPLHGGFHTVNYPVDPAITAAVFVPDYELSTEKARQALPKELPHKDAVYNVSRVGLLPAAMNPVVLAQAAAQGGADALGGDVAMSGAGVAGDGSGFSVGSGSGAIAGIAGAGTAAAAANAPVTAAAFASAASQANALLFTATQDRLHQPYRAPLMPPSTELIALFRSKGYAAAVSGAGPCVLVLHYGDAREAIDQVAVNQLASGHWRVLHLPINTAGVEIERR